MSSIAAPYGFQPVTSIEHVPRPLRIINGILSGLAANIFKYQPVTLVNGLLQPVTNPGGVPQKIFGVFAGWEYAPLGGRPTVSPFFASGTVWDPTLDMLAYFWPAWDPATVWRVQADGSVGQALMGSQFNITNVAAGNTSTGLSGATVGAAGVPAGSQGQFSLVQFDPEVNDTIGDAFTDLYVTTAFPQVGLGSQTSIG